MRKPSVICATCFPKIRRDNLQLLQTFK